MNQNNKLIIKYLNYFLLVVIVLLTALIYLSQFSVPGKYKLFAIMSGSMAPELQSGDLVIIKSSTKLSTNDVITYKDAIKIDSTITHRLKGVFFNRKQIFYITAGDANKDVDYPFVTKKQIIGRVIGHIPYIGKLLIIIKSLPGFVVLIIIPATILIYEEIINLRREIAYKRNNNRKTNKSG